MGPAAIWPQRYTFTILLVTWIAPDHIWHRLVPELTQVKFSREQDILWQVTEIRVLRDDVLVGARHEQTAVVGIGRSDYLDVGETLSIKKLEEILKKKTKG